MLKCVDVFSHHSFSYLVDILYYFVFLLIHFNKDLELKVLFIKQ